MHDPAPMSALESVCDLDGGGQSLRGGQRTVLDTCRERLTVYQLHHEKVRPRLLADVVQPADARMRQRGDRLGFTFESCLCVGIGRWQDLDRNNPVKACVACLIDLAHATGANGGEHFIGSQVLARGEVRRRFILAVMSMA